MILQRTSFEETGIFGQLLSSDNQLIAITLEHSYSVGPSKFAAKIPNGVYPCVRGIHHLEKTGAFETFEVMNVPGHSGILFHAGNFNCDSDGCVLLGLERNGNMITNSRFAFFKFIDLLKGVNAFQLTVL